MGKREDLARITAAARICEEAAEFPTVGHLDAMLDELRHMPRTGRAADLIDMLLDERWQLTAT
jgi:hypothetical protein